MNINQLTIISPALGAPGPSEAHVFGSAAMLWGESEHHFQLPLQDLPRQLLSPIQQEQYILAIEKKSTGSHPVGFVAWANLSAEAENRYLANPVLALQPQDWSSGDRMWFTAWFAPFGHSRALARAVRQLLPIAHARYLHHRNNELGIRVMIFTGNSVSPALARSGQQKHMSKRNSQSFRPQQMLSTGFLDATKPFSDNSLDREKIIG